MIRMMVWNQASADAIRTAEALIKLEAREARLLGRDERSPPPRFDCSMVLAV